MKVRPVPPRKEPSPRKKTARRRAPPPTGHPPFDDLSPFFDSPIDLLCIGDPNAIYQKLNPQWEATLGYPASEMVGKDFMEFVHPDDQAAAMDAFREMRTKPEVHTLTNRVRGKDGSYRWLEWKYILRGGHIYASARDVTEGKRVEDELRESRRMLETVLNTIPARVFWKDRNSSYLGCNQAFAQDAGYSSPVQVVGLTDYQMNWRENAERYRADDREVMETGLPKLGYEEPGTLGPLGRNWHTTSKIPLRDREGNMRGVLGTYEDITGKKLAEQALRESEERYRRITATITDYIYHVRVDDGIAVETTHSPRCLEVTGFSAEEFAADPELWIRMVEPEDRPLVEDQARRILSSQEAPVVEYRMRRKDGALRWVRNTPVPSVGAEGRLASYDGLIQDITERKQAELQIRIQHDLALALNATIDREQGLRLCLQTAMQVSGIEAGGVYLVDSLTGVMELAVHHGIPPDTLAVVGRLEPDRPEARWMMEGLPIYADSRILQSHLREVPEAYRPYRLMIGLPIRHEQRIIGCLSLVSVSVDTIPTSVREILETTVAQIGNAIGRLRSEAALRESEERYRQLFESVSDAVFLAENKSGRILEANSACSALYGYDRDELLAIKNTDLSAEPEKTRQLTQTAPLVPENIITVPLRLHRRKDGTVFPVEITSRYFSWHGTPVHLTAIRDITQRRKIEDDLRESRQMLETVLNTIPVRVFWKDRRSKYLGCNKSFAQDAGFSTPEELIGRDDFQMGWAALAERYRTDDRSVIDTGQAKINYEEPEILPDGKNIWLRTSKIPLRDPDGDIRGVLGTYEDITEYKRAVEEIRALNAELEQRVKLRTAQLEATNKELEAFSFSISHDLRAPLRAIEGYTRALEEDYGKDLDPEGRRFCSVICRNAHHMNELIDGLLTLSRLNRADMEFLPSDMNAMVQSVFEDLTVPENRMRIDWRVGPLPTVTADPILLRQVWVNLISNAIKFSAKRDRARIEIECRCTAEEDVFSVRDNGAGFNPQYVEKLFGVFQRLHSSLEFEGTGIGLAIVQRIIHRHGGRVWAEGEVDKGAAFYFALPKSRNPEDSRDAA